LQNVSPVTVVEMRVWGLDPVLRGECPTFGKRKLEKIGCLSF